MCQRLLWLSRLHSTPLKRLFRSEFSSSSASISGVAENYKGFIEKGVLLPDAEQQNVVDALDKLLQEMAVFNKTMELYHAQVRDWEMKRHEIREKLLLEEAEVEARRQVEKTLAEPGRSPVFKWLSQLYEQFKQRILFNDADKEDEWHMHVYGQAAAVLRKKRPKREREVEAGPGRIVSHLNREKKLDQLVGPCPTLPAGPKGVYIYGSVGCGKTMLMDMFYNAADGVIQHRRRVHFHAALLEVHELMHKLWKQQREKAAEVDMPTLGLEASESLETEQITLKKAMRKWLDGERKFREDNFHTSLLDLVAENLLGNSTRGGACLLCFDELQVVDVFTAVALAGIFGALIKRGAIIVATSNRAPSDLNKEGMQKEIFNQFTEELQKHCHVILMGSDKDYRRLLANADKEHHWENYFWPLNRDATDLLERRWQELVLRGGSKIVPTTVPVMFGRTLDVPRSCGGVARFSFEEICDRPVGAADYIALARNFHTVFVTGIPMMSMRNRDKARRFITLVDELYNHRRQMVCTAASSIDELFLGTEEGSLVDLESLQFETEAEDTRLRRDVTASGDVAPLGGSKEERRSIQSLLSGREELFAFQRAVSRLIEMQSPIYLQGVDLPKQANGIKAASV